MSTSVEIENIEEMRRREGIDDVELREGIRGLRVGDFARLTLRAGAKAAETVVVRITGICGSAYQGRLARQPTSAGLAHLRVGAPVAFAADHIHSLPKGWPAHGK